MIPFDPIPAESTKPVMGELFNRVQDKIKAAITAAASAVANLIPGQVLFGDAGGAIGQSDDLTFARNGGLVGAGGVLSVRGQNGSTLNIMASDAVPSGGFVQTALRFFSGLDTQTMGIINNFFGTSNFFGFTLAGFGDADLIDFKSSTAPSGKSVLSILPTAMDIIMGSSALLAPGATKGFMYIPTISGPPTGVPALDGSSRAGSRRAFVLELPAGQLWAYNGAAWLAV